LGETPVLDDEMSCLAYPLDNKAVSVTCVSVACLEHKYTVAIDIEL
jgi:hypothetical protein